MVDYPTVMYAQASVVKKPEENSVAARFIATGDTNETSEAAY